MLISYIRLDHTLYSINYGICACTWVHLKKKVGGGVFYNNRFYTLRTLLFAGTKFSEISDLPNFR